MRSIIVMAALAALAAPAAAEIARVKSVAGPAFVVRGVKRMPASPGLQIEPGDRLATARGGRLGVTFIDDTRFALAPGAQLLVTRFDYDRRSQSGRFDAVLERGQVAVVAGHIARSGDTAMVIRTGRSALAVRSGRFIVTAP